MDGRLSLFLGEASLLISMSEPSESEKSKFLDPPAALSLSLLGKKFLVKTSILSYGTFLKIVSVLKNSRKS